MNIVHLFTDQHRVDSLPAYGNAVCKTPSLDALAEQGCVFDWCFTPTSICSPARASLLTGLTPLHHRMLANYEIDLGFDTRVARDCTTFPQLLQRSGYQLTHLGKWHVSRKTAPADFGLSGEHFPGWHNPVGHPSYRDYLRRRGLPGFELSGTIQGSFPSGNPGHELAGLLHQPVEATFEHFIADLAIESIEAAAAAGQPFYLGCHWFGPHLPYFIPEEYFDLYDPDDVVLPRSFGDPLVGKPWIHRRYADFWSVDGLPEETWRKLWAVYWGYVSLIDHEVGRVLRVIAELGLDAETAVFFSADHGEFTGAHRLHDKGPAMYDDTYRVPLIARVPGSDLPSRDGRLVSLLDLPATFVELAGGEVPAQFDGRSLLDTDRPRDAITAEFHGLDFPVSQRMLRTHEHKLVVNAGDVDELYDLRADPFELTNLIDDPGMADVRARLLRELYAQLVDSGDGLQHWLATMYDVGASPRGFGIGDDEYMGFPSTRDAA